MRVQIEKLVYGGDGLSRVDGEVVFTPFVLPGETVDIERAGSQKHAQTARLVRVEQASAERVTPPCPVFGKCGGCSYQQASYEAQLRWKRDILAETLARVGKIAVEPARIAIESAEPFGYRNRAQFHFERGRVGYREMNSRRLVPVAACPISSPKVNEALAALNRMAKDRRWPDFVGSLEVFTDERQVQWNVLESGRPVARRFFDWLGEEVAGTVAGPLDYEVGEDTFQVSGTSFFQVNRFLTPRLAALATGDASGDGEAWDLYAGVGLFSLPLARRFGRVRAVEAGRGAADLRINAARAGSSIDVVAEQTEVFLAKAKAAPDFVLADPPRAGLGKSAAARLAELKPKRLVIVACDPATLARDLGALVSSYEIEEITMVDLFPQTFHLETIIRLRPRD
ncbi:MAG TPA: class I SAM-dependent RNA methyltransferase [Bryobacteraceae bacterium]|nr:class I SAM-dependent RNA methyltransferase [Bryobacteraceae bacterium]